MSHSGHGQFGDTTLTKVFVGGLAWETPMETLRDHFLQFGDILEAVVISDKLSGRSKGYGFVTFKDQEAAKAACEDPTPIINNRRANCNLAVLGARRQKATSPTPPLLPQQGSNNNNVGFGMGGKAGGVAVMAPPASHLQWYYPAAVQQAASPFHHQHPQAVPFYGYTPAYVAADYNQKVAYNGGAYYPQQMYSGVAAGHAVIAGAAANTLIPMYGHQHPLYHHYQHQQQLHHHHRAQAMGLPAHMFPVSTPGPITTAGPTALISKPTPVGMQGYGIGAVAVTVGEGLKTTS